jgi:hypothetical protein
MFHNKKNVDHKETQFKAWIEHPTEDHVYMETNTMMKQTWVVTKALWHKISFSLLDQDHMNNDQVQKSREEKTR